MVTTPPAWCFVSSTPDFGINQSQVLADAGPSGDEPQKQRKNKRRDLKSREITTINLIYWEWFQKFHQIRQTGNHPRKLASEITKQDQSRENWTICWDATPPEAQPTSHQNHSPATTLSRSCGWEDPKSTKCHFQFSRTHFQASQFSRTSFELGEHLIPCWKVDIYMSIFVYPPVITHLAPRRKNRPPRRPRWRSCQIPPRKWSCRCRSASGDPPGQKWLWFGEKGHVQLVSLLRFLSPKLKCKDLYEEKKSKGKGKEKERKRKGKGKEESRKRKRKEKGKGKEERQRKDRGKKARKRRGKEEQRKRKRKRKVREEEKRSKGKKEEREKKRKEERNWGKGYGPAWFFPDFGSCLLRFGFVTDHRQKLYTFQKNGERNKREEQNWNQTEERKDGGGKKNNRGRMRGEKDEAGGQSYLPRKRLCLCFSGFVSLTVLMTCLEQPGFGVSCCLGLQFATSIVTFIGTNSHHIYMDLSQNRGTPKSSRLRLFV